MIGYLVGYQGGNIYRIYHPASKEFKVSRDVIFSEKEFFDMRRVVKSDLEDKDMEDGETPSACDETASSGGISSTSETETPAPVIHDEIAVQPLNRKSRRLIARAFKATLKGNWKWSRNYQEAMEAIDAKQWELVMQKEYNSIMKNDTWTLVPRPKDAKVVKSRWVLLTKDNGLHKARFCAKGFTQRWGGRLRRNFRPSCQVRLHPHPLCSPSWPQEGQSSSNGR